jgi:hypothetical protein
MQHEERLLRLKVDHSQVAKQIADLQAQSGLSVSISAIPARKRCQGLYRRSVNQAHPGAKLGFRPQIRRLI